MGVETSTSIRSGTAGPVRTILGALVPLVLVVMASAGADAHEKSESIRLRVMSFNILQGGGNATNVGFGSARFGGSRFDELAKVILETETDVVGIQEDASGERPASSAR
ncbi:MAG: hypothetical protein AAF488_07605 [Planctomycetota bacterium]